MPVRVLDGPVGGLEPLVCTFGFAWYSGRVEQEVGLACMWEVLGSMIPMVGMVWLW
jgi:hypothetical protein